MAHTLSLKIFKTFQIYKRLHTIIFFSWKIFMYLKGKVTEKEGETDGYLKDLCTPRLLQWPGLVREEAGNLELNPHVSFQS